MELTRFCLSSLARRMIYRIISRSFLLSLPGYWGEVTRPMKVKVKAQDRSGNEFEVEDEGMVARCFCHEIDHLDGHMFDELCDKLYTMEEVEKMFQDAAEEGRKELEAKEAE